MMMSIGSD